MTPIDRAYLAMNASSEDDVARLRFFEAFAAAQFFILLQDGITETPRLFDTEDGTYLLAFDSEDRLTTFAEGPADYASLSGRAIAEMIGTQDIGIGLNLGVAPSSHLIPTLAVTWLVQMLQTQPEETSAKPETFTPPGKLPETLLTSLDARLAAAEGLARLAYLVGVTYRDGRKGHLLAIVDAEDAKHPALTRAIADAMAFSNIDAGELDVAFLSASDPAAAKLAKVGLRFDLPTPPKPSAPGNDPTKPPKLR